MLSSDTVLTAAHCVGFPTKNGTKLVFQFQPTEYISVVLGDLTQSKEEGTEQTIKVIDRFIHPDWLKNEGVNINDIDVDNDFAILKLANGVRFTNYVNPICLPPENKNFDSVEAKASGWGRISGNYSESKGSKSDILQKLSKSFALMQ